MTQYSISDKLLFALGEIIMDVSQPNIVYAL